MLAKLNAMNEKSKWFVVFFVLAVAFCLRLYAARTVPLVFDEMDDLPSAQKISFSPRSLNLPLVDMRRESCPIAYKYIVRIGWDLFGCNVLGARIPFVLISVLIIFIVFLFVREFCDFRVAFLSLVLLSISQYDIAVARIANLNPPQVLIFISSLFLFFKALLKDDSRLLLLNGLIIGIGLWFKESIAMLLGIYFWYVIVVPEYRVYLKRKSFWGVFLVAMLVYTPSLILNVLMMSPRIAYVQSESFIAPSLNALGFFLGELILLFLKIFPDLYKIGVETIDMEFPIVGFLLGVGIVAAPFFCWKAKNRFIRLMFLTFGINFIFFSFFRRVNIVNSFFSLGSLDWSIYGFIPGVIMLSFLLDILLARKKKTGKIVLAILLGFMLVRVYTLLSYPLSGYFPCKKEHLKRDLLWAGGLIDGHYERDIYLGDGPLVLSEKLLKGIFKVAEDSSEIKMTAAQRLIGLFGSQKRFSEAEPYKTYMVSRKLFGGENR